MAALRDDVSRRLQGQPIEVRREARLSILTRAMARYRTRLLVACVGLLVITIFTVALGGCTRRPSSSANRPPRTGPRRSRVKRFWSMHS